MSSQYDSLDDYPFRPIREAPSSIDRSSAERVQEDAQTLRVGELLRPAQEVYLNWPGEAVVVGPDGATAYEGTLDPNARFSVSEPGRYRVRRGGETVGSFEVEPADDRNEETVGQPGDFTNVNDDGPSKMDQAVDAPGVVAADNEEAAALAPALRERAGNVGGSVSVDGDTLDVGPVTDADEMLPGGGSDGPGIGAVALVLGVVAVAIGVISDG